MKNIFFLIHQNRKILSIFFYALIINFFFVFSPTIFASTMCWPVKPEKIGCVHNLSTDCSAGFVNGTDSDAAAIDLVAAEGTSVYAPISGTYSFIQESSKDVLECTAKVIFSFNNTNFALYLRHLDRDTTNSGCNESNQITFSKGALIGYVGGNKHVHIQTSAGINSFQYTRGLLGKLFFTSQQLNSGLELTPNTDRNVDEVIKGYCLTGDNSSDNSDNSDNSGPNIPSPASTPVTTCSLDEGPAKGVASICVGNCPLKASEFCWPVKGNIGQLPFTPNNSHEDNDSIDINGNNGYPIYAPITGNYTFGYSYQIKKTPDSVLNNNGMPGCYATVPFEYQGEQLKLRFAHMPYENNTAPGAFGGQCKTGTYHYEVGEQIGVVNSTGNSTGPHLHFGIQPSIQGVSRFPELFLDGVAATSENREQIASVVNNKLCENLGGGGGSIFDDCNASTVKGTLRIYTLDVPSGGNAAMIIKTDDTTIMIDGGEKSAATDVVNFLKNLGVTTIDAYILTHTDNDHAINIPEIFSNFTVKERYSQAAKASIDMDKHNGEYNLSAFINSNGYTNKALLNGQTLCFPNGLKIKAVGPSSSAFYFKKLCATCMSGGYCENRCSVNFLITFGNTKALITGDGILSQSTLLGEHSAELANLDVLQVPHHGLVYLNNDFINGISPKYAFAASESNFNATNSNGGHPWKGTLTHLLAAGTQMFYTHSGNLLFLSDGNSFQAITNVSPGQYRQKKQFK